MLKAAGVEQKGALISGAEIDELSLGQVPNAAHAETADNAKSATDAQTALNAVNAITAQSVNGHEAGCLPGTQAFAGACWQSSPSETAVSAPAAANSCAVQGGTLPEALQLAAFSHSRGWCWTAELSGRATFQSLLTKTFSLLSRSPLAAILISRRTPIPTNSAA